MKTTSRRASSRHGTHTVVIPALLAGNLPRSAVWEIEATATGFSLVYIGEREVSLYGRNRPEPIALPFITGSDS